MGSVLRQRFHEQMNDVEQKVRHLFALVAEGIPAATDALLSGDRELARALAARDSLIDSLYREAEQVVNDQFALQAPVAVELRYLLTVLRVVPELERSHDLVEHIARRGAQGLREQLTPRTRGLVERMGALGADMWQLVGDSWTERRATDVERLIRRDNEMDELHASLVSELAAGGTSLPVAMDMALVARFYERLGDHAVNIGERVRYLADPTGAAVVVAASPAALSATP